MKPPGDRKRKISALVRATIPRLPRTTSLLTRQSAGEKDGGPLSWLYSDSTHTKHLEISNARQQKTGNWFLRSPEFHEFVKEKVDASLLWAHGARTYIYI